MNATITFGSAEMATWFVQMPELAGGGFPAEIDGRTVTTDAAALAALRDVDVDTDGHFDGTHIWIGGSEYRVVRDTGRPAIGPEVKTRVTADEAVALTSQAALAGCDRSEMIRRYIREGLSGPTRAFVAGSPLTPWPTSVSRPLLTYARELHRRFPDSRGAIAALAPLLTAASPADDARYAAAAVEYLLLTYIPTWLQAAGLGWAAAELAGSVHKVTPDTPAAALDPWCLRALTTCAEHTQDQHPTLREHDRQRAELAVQESGGAAIADLAGLAKDAPLRLLLIRAAATAVTSGADPAATVRALSLASVGLLAVLPVQG